MKPIDCGGGFRKSAVSTPDEQFASGASDSTVYRGFFASKQVFHSNHDVLVYERRQIYSAREDVFDLNTCIVFDHIKLLEGTSDNSSGNDVYELNPTGCEKHAAASWRPSRHCETCSVVFDRKRKVRVKAGQPGFTRGAYDLRIADHMQVFCNQCAISREHEVGSKT